MGGLLAAVSLHESSALGSECQRLVEAILLPLTDARSSSRRQLAFGQCSAASAETACFAQVGPVSAIVAGYLCTGFGNGSAQFIAEVYGKDGVIEVERLDGSFVILIADERDKSVHVWTDRAGTRPMFMARAGDFLLLAPEVKCFAGIPDVDRTIVPGSLAAMLCNASLMDEHTYWRGVQLLGPATHLAVRNGSLKVTRYWRREYQPDLSKLVSAERAGEIVAHAVKRQLAAFRKPVLALSGGYDSRIILAACIRAGVPISTITWGVHGLDDADADFQVGRKLAERFGIPHISRVERLEEFPAHAANVVNLTDGLTGHLGGYPQGDAVARELAEAGHDALVVGNQLFDGGLHVHSAAEGLHQAGLNFGPKDFLLLRALLRRDRCDAVTRDYLEQKRRLLDSLGNPPDPNDLKDVLYWRARFPRLIGSHAAVYRQHLDYVSPLLDEEVLQLDMHCTPQQRSEKRWITEALSAAYGDAFQLPTAERHSRANWRRCLRELGPVQRYIVDTLLEPCAPFDEWFDRDRVHAWLAHAMAEGRRATWPSDVGLLRRAKARLGGMVYKHTVKARRVINLLTLKLWFEQFG